MLRKTGPDAKMRTIDRAMCKVSFRVFFPALAQSPTLR